MLMFLRSRSMLSKFPKKKTTPNIRGVNNLHLCFPSFREKYDSKYPRGHKLVSTAVVVTILYRRPDVVTLGNPFDTMKRFCLYSQCSHLNL